MRSAGFEPTNLHTLKLELSPSDRSGKNDHTVRNSIMNPIHTHTQSQPIIHNNYPTSIKIILYPYSVLYRYTPTSLSDTLIILTYYMDTIHIIKHKLTIQKYTREQDILVGRAHHFHIYRGLMSCGRITTLAILTLYCLFHYSVHTSSKINWE